MGFEGQTQLEIIRWAVVVIAWAIAGLLTVAFISAVAGVIGFIKEMLHPGAVTEEDRP